MVGTGGGAQPLRILHVLRAPIGGLWRHVLDLAREQTARGHQVGLVSDASTGGDRAAATLAELSPSLALGISRIPIRRNPHPTDLAALAHVAHRIHRTTPDVVHGHGSKGGLLARLAPTMPGRRRPVRVYTPHGGSLNYNPGTHLHGLYMRAEAGLRGRTDLALFESAFIADRYGAFVGSMPSSVRIVHNGISEAEFLPVHADASATDFLYVGELRAAKGIDTLLEAVAHAGRVLGTVPSLTLVGSGADRRNLEEKVRQTGLQARVTFRDPLPARQAFRLGRVLVVPSRAESLPYIVLEAAGACVPIIATNVGGIPEIFGPLRHRLVPCDDVPVLARRLVHAASATAERHAAEAASLWEHVRANFSIDQMVDGVLAGYREAAARAGAPSLRQPTPAPLWS